MKTSIDKAGRLVIPAAIRASAGLTPGTELEILVDDLGIRLVRAVPGPTLVKDGDGWVAQASVAPDEVPDIDFGELIEKERERWPW